MLSLDHPLICKFGFSDFKFSEQELKQDDFGYSYILAVFDRIDFYCK